MKIHNHSDQPLIVGDTVVPAGAIKEVRGDVWARYKAEREDFRKKVEEKVYEELNLLPGDGDPNCEYCMGRGFLLTDTSSGKRCFCVRYRDVKTNVRRIWPEYDLTTAYKLPKGTRSPLLDLTQSNVWITASDMDFKTHLRYVALRQGAEWSCRVRFDSDLLRAWLFTAKAKGVEIYDVDVSQSELSEEPSIEDLAIPPALLIMVMGVKRTRNVAAPETLMEALMLRQARNRPTWLVDQPDYSITKDGHHFKDPSVETYLMPWKRVTLQGTLVSVAAQPDDILAQSPSHPQGTVTQHHAPIGGPQSFSLSSTLGAKRGGTTNSDIVEHEDKWQPKRGKK